MTIGNPLPCTRKSKSKNAQKRKTQYLSRNNVNDKINVNWRK